MFCKKLLKTTVLVGVLAGGAAVLAGPGRTNAVIHDVKTRVERAIDSRLDDPIALRQRLRELERAYPERIATLRGDLAELEGQIRELDRERAISLRVVELAEEDLAVLGPRLEEAAAAASEGEGRARLAAVSFGADVYTLQRAAAKLRQIENTRVAHANRAADAEHGLTYLRQQSVRFAEALAQLETEQAQFQAQLFQLNRQVDSIQRNERLIEVLAERKRTLEECSSYDAASLDQITGKLDRILTHQAARLDVLSTARDAQDYEQLAREELDDEAAAHRAIGAEGGTLQRVR